MSNQVLQNHLIRVKKMVTNNDREVSSSPCKNPNQGLECK